MKTKVIMSANNKFDLERMLNKFYCSENYYITDNLEIKNNMLLLLEKAGMLNEDTKKDS